MLIEREVLIFVSSQSLENNVVCTRLLHFFKIQAVICTLVFGMYHYILYMDVAKETCILQFYLLFSWVGTLFADQVSSASSSKAGVITGGIVGGLIGLLAILMTVVAIRKYELMLICKDVRKPGKYI